MALDIEQLYTVLNDTSTVEAGLITVLVETRHEIEKISAENPEIAALRELAVTLDAECAKIADAVMEGTPAQGLR